MNCPVRTRKAEGLKKPEAIEMTLEANRLLVEESITQELSSSLHEQSRNFHI